MTATWVFGYGSLIWRPDFAHDDRQPGYIEGWIRRFWQASPDHRGTPQRPGRVVTLLRAADARCWGVAYRLPREGRDEILARLDHREQAGYEHHQVSAHLNDGRVVDALVYVAGPQNPNFIGERTPAEIAARVASCAGPSGPNAEYVERLADALAALGGHDPHVDEVARLVREASRASSADRRDLST